MCNNNKFDQLEKVYSFSEPKTVICDLCNRDGDEQDDEGNPKYRGGALIGSYATCPVCLERIKQDPDYDPEEVELFDANIPFGDNVRAYRMKVQGNSDLVMEMYAPKIQDSIPCPLCYGTKSIEIPLDSSDGNGPGTELIECVLCGGKGTINKEQYQFYKEFTAYCCTCGNPSGSSVFHEGERKEPYYTCADCEKILITG